MKILKMNNMEKTCNINANEFNKSLNCSFYRRLSADITGDITKVVHRAHGSGLAMFISQWYVAA